MSRSSVRAPERPQEISEWDSRWAGELARSALLYISEQSRKLSDAEQALVNLDPFIAEWEDRANEAAERRDREAYREALRGYARAGVEALRAARRSAA